MRIPSHILTAALALATDGDATTASSQTWNNVRPELGEAIEYLRGAADRSPKENAADSIAIVRDDPERARRILLGLRYLQKAAPLVGSGFEIGLALLHGDDLPQPHRTG